jgi:hypothetical protein
VVPEGLFCPFKGIRDDFSHWIVISVVIIVVGTDQKHVQAWEIVF